MALEVDLHEVKHSIDLIEKNIDFFKIQIGDYNKMTPSEKKTHRATILVPQISSYISLLILLKCIVKNSNLPQKAISRFFVDLEKLDIELEELLRSGFK